MKLSDFNYNLPKTLIAQKPASPRDYSKLMVLNTRANKIEYKHFYNLTDYLQTGDVLILNDTQVFSARLIGQRQDTGGKVEVFLLKRKEPEGLSRSSSGVIPAKAGIFSWTQTNIEDSCFRRNDKVVNERRRLIGEHWEVLIGNRRKKPSQIIEFGKGLECEIVKQIDDSVWQVKFNKSGKALGKLIDQLGETPTPPYIKINNKGLKIKKKYQTVYAKHRGSVAAPTAGLHFTKSLIAKLKKRGIQFEYLTLHVGLGTFEPVKVDDIKKHKMHSEYAILDRGTAQRLNQARQEGRRIIAVGTTTVRVLESFVRGNQKTGFRLQSARKWTNIFIYPGYKFKFVDAMITNFHLPKSTLLMLVSAFAGRQLTIKAYQTAVKKKYQFFSFGDAMLIFKD